MRGRCAESEKPIGYKLYTVIITILPAINTYKSPIPNVELGTFLLLVLFLFMILNDRKIYADNLIWKWLIMLYAFLLFTIIASFNPGILETSLFSITFRFLKICAVVLIVIVQGRSWFDYTIAIKTLRIFSLLCVAFIILQSILYYGAGIILHGIYIPLASAEGYSDYNFEYMYSILFRPTSFFFEPSHFCAYALVYFTYLLSANTEKYRRLQLAVMTLGIVMSTSGTGIVLIPITVLITVMLMLFKRNISTTRNSLLLGAIVAIAIIIALNVYINSDVGLTVLQRYIKSDGSLGTAVLGRLDSGAYELYKELPIFYKIIGTGFGNRPSTVYFSSLYSILYGDGLVGLILLLWIIISSYRKSGLFGKLLSVVYMVLMIGTGVFNFASIGLYFSFIHQDIYDPMPHIDKKHYSCER